MDIDLKKLQEPFSQNDIEWRIQTSGISNNKPWALIVPYVTNRAIQQRLDDVCGVGGWKNELMPIDGGFLCGISIDIFDKWVTKWDGAPCTDIEPIKGGISDSMKRCAVQWGMGRHLYSMPKTYAECTTTKTQGYEYAKTKDGVIYWRPPKEEEPKPMTEREKKLVEIKYIIETAHPETKQPVFTENEKEDYRDRVKKEQNLDKIIVELNGTLKERTAKPEIPNNLF